jgi:glycine/D-amino acid oxidase-like deaminating enzyme
MFSYWEQQSFTHYHHIIIGAGIVGLSTAVEIKNKYPADRVLVLERGLLPTGASTRNAGFACMGSATELLDDLSYMPREEVLRLFSWRKAGLEKLRARLGDAAIGYQAAGSHELISSEDMGVVEQLSSLNDWLMPITGAPAFKLANDRIPEFGLATTQVAGLIENTCEGQLHSGMMMRALTDYALQQGIEIKTGAEVKTWHDLESSVITEVQDPFRKEVWTLSSDTITFCTNAFTKQLLPDVDVTPGRGQVLVTKPIPGLKLKGVFHLDKGYYYFREIDGRVLLGGGRNLDFAGETTTDFSLTELIQQDLEQKLQNIIIPGTKYEVDMRWAGIMAFGPTKFPIVTAFSNRVYGAFRMGGMGVALGSEVAAQLVHKMYVYRG